MSEADHTGAQPKAIKQRLAEGDVEGAWALLRGLGPDVPFGRLPRLARLAAEVRARLDPPLPKLRVALLGEATMDHLAEALSLFVTIAGFDPQLYVGEFGTTTQTILDPSSELYAFAPDVVWLFSTSRDVALASDDTADPQVVVAEAIAARQAQWDLIVARTGAAIVHNNAELDPVRPFGNFEGGVPWGRTSLLRAYDVALAKAARPGVTIFDLDWLAGDYGRAAWHDPRWWLHSKHPFAPEATSFVAHAMAQWLAGIRGRARKCLVLDLDNTLWGGVIGDDGVEGIALGPGDARGEAHMALQAYVRRLTERGIVLAVVSKNEEAAAKLPFTAHPHMQLRLDDIAVFLANWTDKATNLREVAATLQLGLDAMVLLDDNPVERALVRQALPMVLVPELGDDPASYVRILDAALAFETATFSDDDRRRAAAYRDNSQRAQAQATHTDLDAFLRDLDMVAEVGEVGEAQLPRFVQLLHKSNQFHLTTTRYGEAKVRALMASPDHAVLYFRLADRFGDNGIIATLVLALPTTEGAPVVIDTWAMSCRVLSRGMEQLIAEQVHAWAARTRSPIEGRYVPTAKNALVAELYGRLGFTKVEQAADGTTTWRLPWTETLDLGHHIRLAR